MEITSTTSATQFGTTPAASRETMDKDSFLKLLITQMQHQDPLSPMDNTQLLAQMAQFSSLEQMQNLNASFETNLLLTQALNNSAAAGLIGRHVRASGDTVALGESGGVELGYFLPVEAEMVTITIYDSQGREVRTLVSDQTDTGAQRFTWNGNDLSGRRVAAGDYRFSVSAKNENGAEIPATSLVSGLVEGVTYRNGGAYLLVGGREISLSEVLEVYQ